MKRTFKVYLSKILVHNKQLELAGIGVLRLVTLPSTISQDQSLIFPPRDQIYLMPSDQRRHDPILLRVMQLVEKEDAETIKRDMDLFMDDVQAGLREKGEAKLPGLGKLMTSDFGEPYFVPNNESQGLNAFFGLPELTLPKRRPTIKKDKIVDQGLAAEPQKKVPSQAWGFIMGLVAVLLIMVSILIFRSWSEAPSNRSERSITISSDGEKRLNVAPRDEQEIAVEDAPPAPNDEVDSRKPKAAIIVGAFAQQDNIDRMVEKLTSQGLRPYQEKGERLTKIGFVCDVNQAEDQLRWAKQEFTSEAWVRKLAP